MTGGTVGFPLHGLKKLYKSLPVIFLFAMQQLFCCNLRKVNFKGNLKFGDDL